jgi:hypothetical protein
MANRKVLILIEVTLFIKNSLVSSEYDLYFDDDGVMFNLYNNKHTSLEILDRDDDKYVDYYLVKDPIYAVNFISDIDNNHLVRPDYTSITDTLKEDISDYNNCNIKQLYNDIKPLFNSEKVNVNKEYDYLKKYGHEKRLFVGLFDEYSYWDSYAGDGDYGINYIKITNIQNISEEMNKKDDTSYQYY